MSIISRLVKLESKTTKAQRGTWKDFISGKWQPAPAEWAAFLAEQKPSDILKRCEDLLEGHDVRELPEDLRARIESMRAGRYIVRTDKPIEH